MGLGVKNISDLIVRETYDNETKNLTNKQIKEYKMIG